MWITENTLEAHLILERIQEEIKDGESHWFTTAPKNPKLAQQYLRTRLRETSYSDRVILTVRREDGLLFVSIKPIPYVKKLELLLQQCLGHIDDEELYDNIMEVMYGNTGQKSKV